MKAHTKNQPPKIKLDSDRLAQLAMALREQRLAEGRSLARTARSMGLSPDQLLALEHWRITEMPPPSHRVGLLQKYAEVLGVSALTTERATPRRQAVKKPPIVLSHWLSVFLVTVGAIVAGGYMAVATYSLIAKPRLHVIAPLADSTIKVGQIQVEGSVGRDTIVEVNGETVALGDKNQFSTTVYLRRGQNVVSIRATNSLGRRSEVTRYLYRE